MQEKYEESLIDLETILKLDPNNTAAKKELQQVTQCKEEMVSCDAGSFDIIRLLYRSPDMFICL